MQQFLFIPFLLAAFRTDSLKPVIISLSRYRSIRRSIGQLTILKQVAMLMSATDVEEEGLSTCWILVLKTKPMQAEGSLPSNRKVACFVLCYDPRYDA